ncbi:MAG: hypothetical protein CVV49_08930 [Spirochaetae bacterium HGW-Spirochaetae-5]|nr:MAG: hypothetical protein CVV49_08930 [Spirochaetae bacterium HGW-Spirochaetae-5]
MITTAQELTDKLLKYYPKTEALSLEIVDALKMYVRRGNFSGDELERMYQVIIENCAGFPQVRTVAKLWKENSYSESNDSYKPKDVNNAKSDYRDTGHNEIVRYIKTIREKQDQGGKLSNKEIDLIHTYEDLCYIHSVVNSLADGVIDRQHKETYIRKAKETIDSGIPINFTAFEREMNRRRAQAVEMYGEQDAEIDSILSKSVSDIENAFGANR